MPNARRPYPPPAAVVNTDGIPTTTGIQYWESIQDWAESILPINLADSAQVTGRLPYANMPQVAASKLLGRGSASGTGNQEVISLGTGLSMSGTTLNAVAEVIVHTTVTLTNAQIKALPSAAYDLIAAPGAGFLTVPFLMDVRLNTNHTSGGYTNIADYGNLYVKYSGGKAWSNFLMNDATLGWTLLIDMFGSVHKGTWQFVPITQAEPTWGYGNVVAPGGDYVTNMAVQLFFNNDGQGDLTGGHADNVLIVEMFYATVEAAL